MSENLAELIRRGHPERAPATLELLRGRIAANGALTDDDLRDAARLSGLPEAAVYGAASFYDDLSATRGARHVRACAGTACFAATGGAHIDELAGGLAVAPG